MSSLRFVLLRGATLRLTLNSASIAGLHCQHGRPAYQHGRPTYQYGRPASASTLWSGPRACVLGRCVLPSVVTSRHKGREATARSHILWPPTFSIASIVHASPVAWQPYMKLARLDKPIGNWLLFLPCAWSISLAAPLGALPDGRLLALFALGACLMRGAGCTINDMWDRDYDSKVDRTKDRPIACGDITRTQALSFLALQLSASLVILLSLDVFTILLGASCIGLVVTYPLMKRITYWPQVFLGLTINSGVLLGWSAATGGAVSWLAALILYGACGTWTVVYDTIYAHQDKEDDILVGVKSTALRFGDASKLWLSGFTVLMASGLLTTGALLDQTWPYYAGVTLVISHITRQIYTVDLKNGEDCAKKFRSNRNLGLLFWAAIIAANLVRSSHDDDDDDGVTAETTG